MFLMEQMDFCLSFLNLILHHCMKYYTITRSDISYSSLATLYGQRKQIIIHNSSAPSKCLVMGCLWRNVILSKNLECLMSVLIMRRFRFQIMSVFLFYKIEILKHKAMEAHFCHLRKKNHALVIHNYTYYNSYDIILRLNVKKIDKKNLKIWHTK